MFEPNLLQKPDPPASIAVVQATPSTSLSFLTTPNSTHMASKGLLRSLMFFHSFLRRRLTNPLSFQLRRNQLRQQTKSNSLPLPEHDQLPRKTIVMDVEGGLLRSSSTFPYFMLVAFEAGGLPRALLLLLLYPLLCFLGREASLRAMVMVCFCGIKKDKFQAGKAVLPKYFLEDVGLEGFELMRRTGMKVCISAMPTVMVEEFLKEYMEVEVVVGRELNQFGAYYTGLMEKSTPLEVVIKSREIVESHGDVVGFGSRTRFPEHQACHLEQVHLVTEAEKKSWHDLPKEKYPKPLVFHDGRLAFRPTPIATLVMFFWLPLGIPLTIFRSAIFVYLPYRFSIPIGAATGMTNRLITSHSESTINGRKNNNRHNLYVCNHRTLLDPVYISAGLNKLINAVTYSVSPVSELLSPIRTMRLTRNKEEDRARMERLLKQGDLVVCPEGTTCREPYLLRFSPMFAEIVDEVIPVALNTKASMFYGTTAAGFKVLDPFYFLMNPWPQYTVEFLDAISIDKSCSSYEFANSIQRKLADVLGFQCTAFSRKYKYLLLAGNEGFVRSKP